MAAVAKMGVKRKLVRTFNPATTKLSRAEQDLLLTDAGAQVLWNRALRLEENCCRELVLSALDGRYQATISFFNHPLLLEAWNPRSFVAYFSRIATECMNHSALISDRGFVQNISDSLINFSGNRVALTAEMFWLMFLHSSHNLVTLNDVHASLVPGQWDRVVSILLMNEKADPTSFSFLLSQVICNLLVARANRYQHSWLSRRLKPHICTYNSVSRGADHLNRLCAWLETDLPAPRVSIESAKGAAPASFKRKPPMPSGSRSDLIPAALAIEPDPEIKRVAEELAKPPSEIGDAGMEEVPLESVHESEEEGERVERSVSEAPTELRMYERLTRSKRKAEA